MAPMLGVPSWATCYPPPLPAPVRDAGLMVTDVAGTAGAWGLGKVAWWWVGQLCHDREDTRHSLSLVGPGVPVHMSDYSFIQPAFIECLLCTRGYSGE